MNFNSLECIFHLLQSASKRQSKCKDAAKIALNLRNDFVLPSSKLFIDHCFKMIEKYDLQNVVKPKGGCQH